LLTLAGDSREAGERRCAQRLPLRFCENGAICGAERAGRKRRTERDVLAPGASRGPAVHVHPTRIRSAQHKDNMKAHEDSPTGREGIHIQERRGMRNRHHVNRGDGRFISAYPPSSTFCAALHVTVIRVTSSVDPCSGSTRCWRSGELCAQAQARGAAVSRQAGAEGRRAGRQHKGNNNNNNTTIQQSTITTITNEYNTITTITSIQLSQQQQYNNNNTQ